MSSGELLLTGSHVGFTGDTIGIMDPVSGALAVVLERTPPKSADSAISQVMGPVANADWIVWQESGFTLEASDWMMWAKDRHTGAIHKVASHELDASGNALPGWASDITLLGNTAAWSAPAPAGAAAEQRIYVADLAAGSVKRLPPNARWPFLVSPGTIEAVVATGATSDDKVLSEPASVSIGDGHVASLGIMDPTRLLAFAASSSGSVTLRRLRDADDGTVVADAVTSIGGVTRSFALPIDWGLAAAGDNFLAWSDQQHLWILPADSAEPIQLAEVAGEMGNLHFRAGGTRLYWHMDGQGTTPATDVLMTVTCP